MSEYMGAAKKCGRCKGRGYESHKILGRWKTVTCGICGGKGYTTPETETDLEQAGQLRVDLDP